MRLIHSCTGTGAGEPQFQYNSGSISPYWVIYHSSIKYSGPPSDLRWHHCDSASIIIEPSCTTTLRSHRSSSRREQVGYPLLLKFTCWLASGMERAVEFSRYVTFLSPFVFEKNQMAVVYWPYTARRHCRSFYWPHRCMVDTMPRIM